MELRVMTLTPEEELRLHQRMERTENQMKFFRFLSIVQLIIIGGLIVCLS